MKLGRRSKLAAKLVVSLGLLAWLVAEVGTHRIARSLSSTDLALLAAAFLLIYGDNVLRSYNWRLLLGTDGPGPGFPRVLWSFLVGGFFGSFIPSSLGPDAARAVALARGSDAPVTRTASSVVMLNLLGLWALGVMFLVGVVVLLRAGSVPGGLWWLAAACAGGVVALPALLATRAPLPELRPSSTLGKRVAEFLRALAEYRSAGTSLVPAFGIALANQALAVLVVFTVFRAGGLDVPLVYFAAIVPVVHVSRLVPASVAGFGAEQGVVVGLFHLAGVEPAAAFAMSVLVSGLNLVVQALSGLLYAGASARSLRRSLRQGEDGPVPGGGEPPAAGPAGTGSGDPKAGEDASRAEDP